MTQDESPAIRAATEAVRFQVETTADIKAILGHLERIDTHLATQNGRINKNEGALANTNATMIGWLERLGHPDIVDQQTSQDKAIWQLQQEMIERKRYEQGVQDTKVTVEARDKWLLGTFITVLTITVNVSINLFLK